MSANSDALDNEVTKPSSALMEMQQSYSNMAHAGYPGIRSYQQHDPTNFGSPPVSRPGLAGYFPPMNTASSYPGYHLGSYNSNCPQSPPRDGKLF